MAGVVADSGVEDIIEGVSAEEDIADDTHRGANQWISPESSKVSNRIDDLFLHSHPLQEIVVVDVVFC